MSMARSSKYRKIMTAAFTVIAAIVIGVISNRLDAATVWASGMLSGVIGLHFWWWIILFLCIIGVVSIVAVPLMLRYIAVLQTTKDRYAKYWSADDSLLRVLASWDTRLSDHQSQMKKVLAEALNDTLVHFDGNANSAAVILPDPE